MVYTFDFSSFLAMPKELNCRTLASFLRPLNINRNTYSYWKENEDLPLDKMLEICKHYDIQPSIFITSPSKDDDTHSTQDIFFRRNLFSDFITKFSHRTVNGVCKILGISTATFTRYLRPSKNSAKGCISVKEYIRWCNTLGVNPIDFIYKGTVTIKIDY